MSEPTRRKPGRIRALKDTLATLDGLLFRKVRSSFNGEERQITALEAIVHQLMQKEAAGDGRAGHVLLKYEELARQGLDAPPQIAFVDNDYTDALTASPTEADNA